MGTAAEPAFTTNSGPCFFLPSERLDFERIAEPDPTFVTILSPTPFMGLEIVSTGAISVAVTP
jgi:hypothetical protein